MKQKHITSHLIKFISFCLLVFLVSCKKEVKVVKVDLSKLQLNEKIEKVISYNDSLYIGVETVEYPFCLLIEVDNSTKYNFDGIELKNQNIVFQINSELLKTDSITKSGGSHIDLKSLRNENDLKETLKKFKAEDYIYGIRIEMDTTEQKNDILKKIERKYGKGTRNPNTDNGLYWNLKKLNKYIFYAPDYNRLIILNSTNLSKTCYWDIVNGLIDFGGCDKESYFKDLLVNTTKPEDIKNKPKIKIDKNWNVNGLTIGQSNESDFLKSTINKNFERATVIQGSDGEIKELTYNNEYNYCYFFFNLTKKSDDNPKFNILSAYSISDFERLEISFENGLLPFCSRAQVLQKFKKDQIENYNDYTYSNNIKIKNDLLDIGLYFNDKDQLSSLYILNNKKP
jgi:hypothetical protein